MACKRVYIIGSQRKLSQPLGPSGSSLWTENLDIVLTIFFPQYGQIRAHQTRVQTYSSQLPAGFYWYGPRRRGPGRPPKWVDHLPCPTSRNSQTHTLCVLSLTILHRKQTLSSTPTQEPNTNPNPCCYPLLRSLVKARGELQGRYPHFRERIANIKLYLYEVGTWSPGSRQVTDQTLIVKLTDRKL